jgi:hypothetical protein
MLSVAALALGSRPKQGLAKARVKREAQESYFMLLGVQESAREWTLTLPNELPLWELESQWIPESSRSDCRVKTQWIKEFFISLEIYWNLNV